MRGKGSTLVLFRGGQAEQYKSRCEVTSHRILVTVPKKVSPLFSSQHCEEGTVVGTHSKDENSEVCSGQRPPN